MWDDLAVGALGAIVLVDTRRLDDCFPAIDYFEHLGLPFIVAVNRFDDNLFHPIAEVRDALDIDRAIPIIECDARARDSVKCALVSLLEVVLARAGG
jgi:hypothetical protein